MAHVTLDEATREKLAGANGEPVELRGAAGKCDRVLPYAEKMRNCQLGREAFNAWIDQLFPPEKVREIMKDPRPLRTMDEVLTLVEGG